MPSLELRPVPSEELVVEVEALGSLKLKTSAASPDRVFARSGEQFCVRHGVLLDCRTRAINKI